MPRILKWLKNYNRNDKLISIKHTRKSYNKSVRNRIPEIIRHDQGEPRTRILEDREYIQALMIKLTEETQEMISAQTDKRELAKEIGDVYEILNAIIEYYHLDRFEIVKLKDKRREERGGFEKKIFLESVKEKK